MIKRWAEITVTSLMPSGALFSQTSMLHIKFLCIWIISSIEEEL